jgi:Leucine-rich repeat (LRR) protein
MKQLQILVLFLVVCLSGFAQTTGNDAASIRQQMAAIRKSTNWSDPAAAKAANVKIQELAAKLTQAIRQSNQSQQQSQQNSNETPEDAKTKNDLQQKMDDYNTKLWNQMMVSAAGGKGADILLAKPIREKIKEDYKRDDDKTQNSPDFLKSMPFLLINMAMPGVQAVIDQMPNFKGIKVLVITSGGKPAGADLAGILKNAKDYPLESLYITNFGQFLIKIPAEVFKFSNLSVLGIYNNKITTLSPEIGDLKQLKELYIDVNPINSLAPWIPKLTGLTKLGIAKTGISTAEITAISKQIPNCQILEK